MKVAIIGAGIGGLAAGVALQKMGIDVEIFEQARQFQRVGGGINLTPNSVKALRGLGLDEHIRARAFRPAFRLSRRFDTGAIMLKIPTQVAEERFQTPQLVTHRADLLEALQVAFPAERVRFGKRLVHLSQTATNVTVAFEDGFTKTFDAVIGADGIHSMVNTTLFGATQPRFTGIVAYRAIVASAKIPDYDLDCFVKWWGPTQDNEMVTFPIASGKELFLFASRAEPTGRRESWSAKGDLDGLRQSFAGYHQAARDVLAACDDVLATAMYDRDPLAAWSNGRVTLLGDAAHPMLPFMAQGAAMGLEDAVVLARCLSNKASTEIPGVFKRYEATRLERTAMVQRASRRNDEWLRQEDNSDWVFGYDPWAAALA